LVNSGFAGQGTGLNDEILATIGRYWRLDVADGVHCGCCGGIGESSAESVYACGFQAALWCVLTLTNVNEWAQSTSRSAYITILKGDAFELWRWSGGS
jgi:hypothetical protein